MCHHFLIFTRCALFIVIASFFVDSRPQFQAAISSARISFNATSEERRLDTRRWKSCSSFKLSRRSMNWYWCMKMEFKFNGWAFLLKISWGIIRSQMALSFVCTACMPLEKLWSIPPPLTAKFCISGTLHVWVAYGCPGIWICFYGRVTWKLEVGMRVWRVCICAHITIGIEAGRHYHRIATHCWWVSGEGRRRRRWWSRRRRNSRHCNYRYECEFYVKGWVEIGLVLLKFRFELWYWIRSKKLDGIVFVYIKSIWESILGKMGLSLPSHSLQVLHVRRPRCFFLQQPPLFQVAYFLPGWVSVSSCDLSRFRCFTASS